MNFQVSYHSILFSFYIFYFLLFSIYFKLTGFACILELMAEPLYILSQNLLLLKLRLMVETTATILRCLTTYILIIKQPNMVIT